MTVINQLLAALHTVPPADMSALDLLERLRTDSVSVAELIDLQPQMEEAASSLLKMGERNKQVLQRCERLQPVYCKYVPKGF